MMKAFRRWMRGSDCQSDGSKEREEKKDQEVAETKDRIRQKLHEQAQRLHYLEVATEVERVRATKKDKP